MSLSMTTEKNKYDTSNDTSLPNDTQNDIDDYKYSISSWEDENCNLKMNLLRGIYTYGFENPTPIQCQSTLKVWKWSEASR